MIEIEAVLDNDGILKACKAAGHAGAGKSGSDIVCAAVSILLRTAFSTLLNKKGIKVQGGAPERGQLWLEVEYEAEGREYLFAVGEFLVNGLSSLTKEFPNNCKLTIKEI
ncbi:MAG: ribosomal-processing cysteine protease Prp [Treponema sp.]|nr:ribosomal-processing cysteine protease Prp [Treponema sp.]